MSNVEIGKLNVPIGLYLISLAAIGFGDYYDLCTLFCAGVGSGAVSFVIICYTFPSYVRRYLNKEKEEKNKTKSG